MPKLLEVVSTHKIACVYNEMFGIYIYTSKIIICSVEPLMDCIISKIVFSNTPTHMFGGANRDLSETA